MTVTTVHGDETSGPVERAQSMWSEGDTQGALILLKTTVRARPEAEDARRALVGFYREIRHLDQAGRWAIAVDGWTTALEKERLARLLALSSVARGDLTRFLALPSSPDTIVELRELMDGPVRNYLEAFSSRATPESRRSDRLGAIADTGWAITVVASILGLAAVYFSTVFDVGDPQGFARLVGILCAAPAGIALLAQSGSFAAERRWLLFGVAGSGWLLLTAVFAAGLVRLLTA